MTPNELVRVSILGHAVRQKHFIASKKRKTMGEKFQLYFILEKDQGSFLSRVTVP